MSHERLGILTHKKDFKILFLIENSSQEDNLYRLISTRIGFSFFFFFKFAWKDLMKYQTSQHHDES